MPIWVSMLLYTHRVPIGKISFRFLVVAQGSLVLRLFSLAASFILFHRFSFNLYDLEVDVLSFILDLTIGGARSQSSILSTHIPYSWNRPRNADSRKSLALESGLIPLFRIHTR